MLQQYFLFKKLGDLQVQYIKFEQQTQILPLQANSSESWSCNNVIWLITGQLCPAISKKH